MLKHTPQSDVLCSHVSQGMDIEEASTGDRVLKNLLINAVETYWPDRNCRADATSRCAAKVRLWGTSEDGTLWTDLTQPTKDNTSTNGMTNNKR